MSYQALLFCPDEKTARVVTQVLTELDFSVEPCNEPFAAVKKLMAQHFDAIVVDCENEQNATLLFKSARNSGSNQSSLAVAVVEGQAGVAKAFRIGANLVLTKPINVEQSKGTLRVARGLLRKGAEAKTAMPSPAQGSPSAATPSLSSTEPPVTMPKPGFGAVPPAKTPSAPETHAVDTSVSNFEFENEPEPQPEPAEAALLESMPDPVSGGPHPSSPATKDYPWQPVSKPLAEPMASALRRAAEAAGKPVASAADSQTKVTEIRSRGESAPWGPGTASAPAPAKESPWPSQPVKDTQHEAATLASAPAKTDDKKIRRAAKKTAPAVAEPAIAAPTFSMLDGESEKTGAGGSKKTVLIAVVLILVLAAAGYFGWTKLHLGELLAPKPPAPAHAPAPAPMPAPQATTPAPAAAAPVTALPASRETTTPFQPLTSTEAPPSAKVAVPSKKETEPVSVPAGKPSPATKAPERVVVTSEAPKPAVHKPVEEAGPPPAPPALGVGGESNSQALSGIVSATPISVPQPSPQMLRVSQGVSQGLLLRRVQPIYPAQAMQMRVQGAVQLQAVVSKEGNITEVKVLSGDGILARAAVDAVKQWKYKPYYLNGEPVEIQTQITVNFKLP
jgi:protein TonB